VSVFMLISVVMLAVRRRPAELVALLLGFLLLILAVHLAKAGVGRARPSGSLVRTLGSTYPSGHSAYSTAYVAMAVIAARVLPGLGSRAALVLMSMLVCAAVGMSRIYLRAHYWSDVVGGWGLGLGIFALCAAVGLVVVHLRNTWQAERV
jgi:membrane-associated phospholipid phosphatase